MLFTTYNVLWHQIARSLSLSFSHVAPRETELVRVSHDYCQVIEVSLFTMLALSTFFFLSFFYKMTGVESEFQNIVCFFFISFRKIIVSNPPKIHSHSRSVFDSKT